MTEKETTRFDSNALMVLCKRYLRKGPDFSKCGLCSEAHETPEQMLDRVSYGNIDYYNAMARLDFLPNSPTLFNAGVEGSGTSSGCFKFDIPDTMEGILGVATKSGMVQKWGGGVGYCLSALRAKNSPIRSTHGKACGPVAVLYYYHALAKLITQGGKREGAQMGILSCDHPDILEFIGCKTESPTDLDTFNISVACTDKFMHKATTDSESPESNLLNLICKNAYENGDPGIYFIDTAERGNPTPHLGKLTGTNPCGENPLLDNESCNLGSINLANFVTGPKDFNLSRLAEVTRLGVRFLETILDNNYYSEPIIEEATKTTRKIGLGVMGWADFLALLSIPYGSEEAIEVARMVMDTIKTAAQEESLKLGAELGPYPGSKGDPRRHAAVTCIAPTGSISILANCSSGIEPHFSLEFVTFMGDRTPIKRKVDVLEKNPRFTPKTALEIPWKWHLAHQTVFQEYLDLAVSKTVNLPNAIPLEEIRPIFVEAWQNGCIGVTVYREGSRVIEAMTSGSKVEKPKKAFPVSDYDAKVHRFTVGDLKGFFHWGIDPSGLPQEVFITASKQGSTVDGLLDALAILISISLQSGVPLADIIDKMRGTRFEPSGLTSNPDIPTASSLLDYFARYAEGKFLEHDSNPYSSGMFCPDCYSPMVHQEGCLRCTNSSCGYSRC